MMTLNLQLLLSENPSPCSRIDASSLQMVVCHGARKMRKWYTFKKINAGVGEMEVRMGLMDAIIALTVLLLAK